MTTFSGTQQSFFSLDIRNEYDPARPNDYEEIRRDRERQRVEADREAERQEELRAQKAAQEASLVAKRLSCRTIMQMHTSCLPPELLGVVLCLGMCLQSKYKLCSTNYGIMTNLGSAVSLPRMHVALQLSQLS